jgi:hypothetical protein
MEPFNCHSPPPLEDGAIAATLDADGTEVLYFVLFCNIYMSAFICGHWLIITTIFQLNILVEFLFVLFAYRSSSK